MLERSEIMILCTLDVAMNRGAIIFMNDFFCGDESFSWIEKLKLCNMIR
jgi:hypothetical protein